MQSQKSQGFGQENIYTIYTYIIIYLNRQQNVFKLIILYK